MMRALIRRGFELIDAIAPPPIEDGREGRRRVRVLVLAAVIGATILLATAATTLFLELDRRLVALNVFWGAVIFGTVLVSRWLGSATLLANTLVSLGFLHTLLLSSLAGGRNVGALFGFSVFPLVAVLVSGWRAGLVFTGLSAAAVIVTPHLPLDLLARAGIDAPSVPLALQRDALNVIFAIGFLSSLYDFVRNSTLSDARQARESAEASHLRARVASERQQKLIEISRQLQNATVENFVEEVHRAMELTARLADANRTVLQLLHDDDYVGRYAWGETDPLPVLTHRHVSKASRMFRWSARLISKGRITQVRRLSELPPEAAPEREYLESRGVVSWLCVPISAGGSTVGYQSFETTSQEKVWDEDECDALRLMTEIIVSAVLRDRTTRALDASEKKFAGAFRDHPDAMAITDLESDEILECNERWLVEMAAAEREEVLGRTPWEFGFEFPADHLRVMKDILATDGHTPAVEVPVLGRKGDRRTYLISATRIDIAGRACVLVHAHDLTERKELEQQLLHAQKMEAVGRLAGGIAHDFNNMLTVISGYSSSLIAQLEGEDRQSAEEIHHAARRSADLTRQLLAFSRRQMLQTEILDPNVVLTNLQSMLRPLIGESISLRLEMSPSPGLVRSDRGQLEQAIVNLVVNSRDAMPAGGTLTLSTRRVELERGVRPRAGLAELEPGSYVVIGVQDEGHGIDPELLDHVMEPFYTTKPEGEGTGLGLPMVHGVARQCGGTLVLENGDRGGTRAEIHLPVADGQPSAAPGDSRRPVAPNESAPRCILLVEDEPTLRRLAARTLRAEGFEVFEAEDGAAALARADELGETVDLVLSDVVMPNLSGIELVRRLRTTRPDLPVVLMSGYPEAAGGGGGPIPDDVLFLLKPFEPSQLCQSVTDALRAKSGEELTPID